LPQELDELSLLGVSEDDAEAVSEAARAGRVAGEATNYARRLVNLPPNEVTPSRLAEEAAAAGESTGLEVEVLGPDQLERLGMGAFLAVARGSEEPARLMVLRHRGKEGGPRIAFIGKGLTFDSGGLSIKPAEKMETMKQDMAGAAAVLGALRAVGQLKLGVDVLGVIPAAENLPSGRAYRPGDIVKALNGKTIEIVSTDAEGRLLLADGLAYARQLGATHLIDVATLTGACIIALGHVAAGVMGNDSPFLEAVLDAGDRAGERMWRLPLFPEYRAQLDSKTADLKNVGGRPAGTITGAWFLREFVGDTAWAHMDIAGTAWSEKDEPHQVEGATGAGTRTLIALAERMAGGVT
ncbi:MAG: leucyl aminopeptidase, partial [Armatimonadota bacterium]